MKAESIFIVVGTVFWMSIAAKLMNGWISPSKTKACPLPDSDSAAISHPNVASSMRFSSLHIQTLKRLKEIPFYSFARLFVLGAKARSVVEMLDLIAASPALNPGLTTSAAKRSDQLLGGMLNPLVDFVPVCPVSVQNSSSVPCSSFSNCSACVESDHCRWCASSFQCQSEDSSEVCEWVDQQYCKGVLFFYIPRGFANGGGVEFAYRLPASLNSWGYRALVYTYRGTLRKFDSPSLRQLQDNTTYVVGAADAFFEAAGWIAPPVVTDRFRSVGATTVQMWLGYHPEFLLDYPKSSNRESLNWGYSKFFNRVVPSDIKLFDFPVSEEWYQQALPPCKLDPKAEQRQSVALFDNDSPAPPSVEGVKAIRMSGFTRAQLMEQMKASKVVYDMGMPGYEWGNIEATLMGNVLLGTAHIGSDDAEIPDDHKLMDGDPELAFNALSSGTANYNEEFLRQCAWQQHVWEMQAKVKERVLSYLADDVLFQVAITDANELRALAMFIATVTSLYPFSMIEIASCSDPALVRMDLLPIFEYLESRGSNKQVVIYPLSASECAQGRAALYRRHPVRRRKWTLMTSTRVVFLDPDFFAKLEQWLQPRLPCTMFANYETAPAELSQIHFVQTELYYRRMRAAASLIPDPSTEQNVGAYLSRMMKAVFGQAGYQRSVMSSGLIHVNATLGFDELAQYAEELRK